MTSQARNLRVEGCLTFWEDCGPLASLVTNLLGTRGNSFLAQSLAKSKFRTQDTLMQDNREYQHKPTTSFFASKVSGCRVIVSRFDAERLNVDADKDSTAQAHHVVLRVGHGWLQNYCSML